MIDGRRSANRSLPRPLPSPMRVLAVALTVLVIASLCVACDATESGDPNLPPAPTATESGAPEIHYYRLAQCAQCDAYAEKLRAHVATHPRKVVVRDFDLGGEIAAQNFAWWDLGEPREGLAFIRPDFGIEGFAKGFGFSNERIDEELRWLLDAVDRRSKD